ncbi:MAG: hypothetical protein JXB47_06845 [Anaerolineae bacterium]|nr:hypothetical protein [Anaerolineae bacterium]
MDPFPTPEEVAAWLQAGGDKAADTKPESMGKVTVALAFTGAAPPRRAEAVGCLVAKAIMLALEVAQEQVAAAGLSIEYYDANVTVDIGKRQGDEQ